MSNNSHFLAVDAAELSAEVQRGDFDLEDLFSSPAVEWCGDTFETGYVFREQLDTVVAPLLDPAVRALVEGNRPTQVDHPALLAFADALEWGMEVTAFTPAEFATLRAAVARAVDEGDWGYHDNFDWAALATDSTTGDFYLLVEFV